MNRLGSFLDTIELLWRCILRKQLEKVLAVILGCMSVAILVAEATILPSWIDLSFFSVLLKAVGKEEMQGQIAAFIPLLYMCVCTYYSLFKIGMLMFYSLTPRQTSSVSLLMICSMVARYAPPISYNFLNLIRLAGDAKTTFEKRMGNIDDAVPFFGKGFNKIYPLIMVIYTILVATNFFGRVIDYFRKRIRFRFQIEEQDLDGYDPSGVIILQKERSWLEQGHKVGELVLPLARNFYDTNVDANVDVEFGNAPLDKDVAKKEAVNLSYKDDSRRSQLDARKEDNHRYSTNQESITNKQVTTTEKENTKTQASLSLLSEANSEKKSDKVDILTDPPAKRLAATWASMKTGFQNLKANVGPKKFLPLKANETSVHTVSSPPESLENIFERLKQKPKRNYADESDFDDDGEDRMSSR